MENFQKFIDEGDSEEIRNQIIRYLEENNIVLTEAQIEEVMPKWMQDLGTGAALIASLAGAGGPGVAHAGEPTSDSDAPAQQVQSQADDYAAALGAIQRFIQSGDSIREKEDYEHELMNVQKALQQAAAGDSSGVDGLDGKDAQKLQAFMDMVDRADEVQYGRYLRAGQLHVR